MLDHYYVRPKTADRIRGLWLGPAIDRYTAWMAARGALGASGSWLGHVSLETTNRYAEITVRMKEAAMKLCEPPITDHAPRKPAWRDDAALLTWLASL